MYCAAASSSRKLWTATSGVLGRASTLHFALPTQKRTFTFSVVPLGASDDSTSQSPSTSTLPHGSTVKTVEHPGTLVGRIKHFFSKENITAPEGYNRFRNVPFTFLLQTSIGSVYAWSLFNAPLVRDFGVVTSAAGDWTLGNVMQIFGVTAFSLGVATAFLGPWAERVGPRLVGTTAACAWSGGLVLSSLGVLHHSLPLLYVGYGVLGGIGWGLGYITPVSTLMKWFPDKRGLATGLALTAFGGGAMLATPLNEVLFNYFFELPQYLGSAADVTMITEQGRRFVEVAGELKEVVVATASDVATLPGAREALPGVYVVGTGNTGASKTFLSLAGIYFSFMMAGTLGQRIPKEGWMPEGWTPKQNGEVLSQSQAVHYTTALKTPQFYLFWFSVAGNAIAGVTVMSCAKTIMTDIFSASLPTIVNGTFAAAYVASLSAANMTGRLGWAAASDYLGRSNTYKLFGLGIPICIGLPYLTNSLISNPSPIPLYTFIGGSMLMLTFYGGVFSVLPAYLADVFGSKHVGAIHGRALTAWSAAALGGPLMLASLRSSAYDTAVNGLVEKINPDDFKKAFGAPVEELTQLVQAKTVTISQLMEIVPPGTLDPTPGIYNTTMYAMSALLAGALVCNLLIKPVDPKHYIGASQQQPQQPVSDLSNK